MKAKILIVAAVFWLVAAVGGGLWGTVEQRWQRWTTPAGVLEVRNLKELYEAGLFDEVLKESDLAEAERQYPDYLPQVLYIRWATCRRLERNEDSERLELLFLSQFPRHPLAADVYFSQAMRSLARGDYVLARNILALMASKFPKEMIAAKAGHIRHQLTTIPQYELDSSTEDKGD